MKENLPGSATKNIKSLMSYVRQVAARVAKTHALDLSRNGLQRAEPVKLKRTFAT
jgi:hypothetical protein